MESRDQQNSLLSGTAQEKIERYLELNPDLERINTAKLADLLELGVTRQRVAQVLNKLGDVRHKRTAKTKKVCPVCEEPITRNATACRKHSHQQDNRIEGYKYRCKLCNKFKTLSEFTRSKRSPSGYEHRCLECRAAWQRNYNKTRKGREKHKKAVKSLIDKHPERRRAYYQVFKAIKNKTLVKLPCESCGEEKTQAVHTDYNRPLDVRWFCRLCASRVQTAITPYTPNKIEEAYREFINANQESNNISGKWLATLKRHYGVSSINEQTLKTALSDVEHIPGIGKGFYELTKEFLGKGTKGTEYALSATSEPSNFTSSGMGVANTKV